MTFTLPHDPKERSPKQSETRAREDYIGALCTQALLTEKYVKYLESKIAECKSEIARLTSPKGYRGVEFTELKIECYKLTLRRFRQIFGLKPAPKKKETSRRIPVEQRFAQAAENYRKNPPPKLDRNAPRVVGFKEVRLPYPRRKPAYVPPHRAK